MPSVAGASQLQGLLIRARDPASSEMAWLLWPCYLAGCSMVVAQQAEGRIFKQVCKTHAKGFWSWCAHIDYQYKT